MKQAHAELALCVALGWMLAIAGCGQPAQSGDATLPVAAASPRDSSAPDAVPSAAPGAGRDALRRAAADGKYLFAFFFKADDEPTIAMRTVFQEAAAELADRADAVEIDVTSAAERDLIDEFGLDRAPTPLVLAFAPNGAVTGGFPQEFSKSDFLTAFVSAAMERCMKHLQDGKLVLLCIQNGETKENEEALAGVNQFVADPSFRDAAEIIRLDPSDESEASFLKDLEIAPDTAVAVTVLLAPPGSPVAVIEGATTKDQLVTPLLRACGPGGCGPGGCGPQ